MSVKKRRAEGFTMIELIIASALSGIVLTGAFAILTNMVQTEISGMRTGTVTAWSLAGISVMNTDISGASHLVWPSSGSYDDYLTICTNWSSKMGPGPLDATAGNAVYSYCYDNGDSGTPFHKALLRHVTTNGVAACPGAFSASNCTAANYGSDSIVVTGVYYNTAPRVFYADPNTPNAVRLNYAVGNPAGGQNSAGGNVNTQTVTPVAVSIPFDTEIILED